MTKKTTVDITPDKSLIQKLGLTGYRTEQAIAELVDNSIDARIPGKIEQIDIRLDFEKKTITVADNGQGMNLKELQDALTIAKETKEGEKLGRFGLGMKSSCSTLGKSFDITTSKPKSDVEFAVRYDEDKWINDKSLKWSNFKVEESSNESGWHGTTVITSNLKVPLYPNQASKFKKRFGIRYGPHLKTNQIRLRINSLACRVIEPQIQRGTRRDLDMQLPSKHRIRGWIGLLEKRSIKGDYGIHLYRQGRLIRSYDKFGIRQHPEYAKIIGELSLDHVPVNFHKTGFMDDSSEYNEAVNEFKNNPAVKEALRNVTSKNATPSVIQKMLNYFEGEEKAGKIASKISKANAELLLREASGFVTMENGKRVMLEFADGGKNGLHSIEKDGDGLRVMVNRKSAAFSVVKNPLFLVGLIEAEAKLASKDYSRYLKFLEQRNVIWTRFIENWSLKEAKKKRKRADKTDALPSYYLNADLVSLHDYLKDRFEHSFQFTGLSTLSQFLQNAYGRIIFTAYTIRGAGLL